MSIYFVDLLELNASPIFTIEGHGFPFNSVDVVYLGRDSVKSSWLDVVVEGSIEHVLHLNLHRRYSSNIY